VRLEKWKRNAIFEGIVAGGLDPHDCVLSEGTPGAEGPVDARISHMPSGSYFILGGDVRRYTGSSKVGDSDVTWPFEAFSWRKVEEHVQRWAEEVKHDLDTPDRWAELQHEREILTGVRNEAVENTPFSADERAEIAERLREIGEYLTRTYALSSEQMLLVEAKLDEIESAAGRIGRKDWLLLLFGVMFEVIVTGLLPPDIVQHILTIALDGLDQLFGGDSPARLPPGR
jgi:hypothetical protein